MDFKQLKAAGAFLSTDAIKKEIVWKKSDEEEIKGDLWVRRHPTGALRKILNTEATPDLLPDVLMVSKSIAKDQTGKTDMLTYEDVYQMDPAFFMVLYTAVWEVQNPKKKTVKKPKSGTSSSSPELVEEPSTKPSND